MLFPFKTCPLQRIKKTIALIADIYVVLKLIEILTLVPKEEINDAVDFIDFKLGENGARLSTFWSYISKKRLKNYDPELWNINKTD
ncbi:hypothetical protein HZS_655 [Henneguya salminicola]|nr:hypothetical protein HZS_655 [Henneguya salminicola]